MSDRTFKIASPHMTGRDISAWQTSLNQQMRRWHADDLIKVDGDYGIATRSYTSKVLYGLGIAQSKMADGVTPELRTKVRDQNLTVAERARYVKRAGWRKGLSTPSVSYPVHNLITDTWGYHPGVHDGVDLICPEGEPLHAICDGIIRRVSDDWWGLGNPGGAVGDRGDGIVVLESTISEGPFAEGLHFGYGHAEHPRVKVGDHVKAGQIIALAGFANAGHTHFMVNDDPPVNGLYKGVGDRDPRPYLTYAKKNG
jgi:murein DD-endopeptidase MepM/ murein hydrolase activator NlpD